jgi:hypothetical protein
MSDRLSLDVPEPVVPDDAWARLLAVLAGRSRPAHDAASVRLVSRVAAHACDVRLRPGRFELWQLSRGSHHQYRFESAAPVLHQLMKLLGVTRIAGPHVGLLQRTGLGSHFEAHQERAVWIVPDANEIELFVREAPKERGPRVAVPAPATGPWAVPAPCLRKEVSYAEANSPCPHCGDQPAFFRELPSQSALVCPSCGRSFGLRKSRF